MASCSGDRMALVSESFYQKSVVASQQKSETAQEITWVSQFFTSNKRYKLIIHLNWKIQYFSTGRQDNRQTTDVKKFYSVGIFYFTIIMSLNSFSRHNPRSDELLGHYTVGRELPHRGHMANVGRVHSDRVRGAVLLLLHRLRTDSLRQGRDTPLLEQGCFVYWVSGNPYN